MPNHWFCIAIAVAGIVLQTGCDPVRTTRQTVHIEILNAENDTPVPGMQVRLKDGFDLPTEAENYEHQRQFWEQLPWFSASTNSEGLATISVESTMIDRSRTATPSRSLIDGFSPFEFELVAPNGDTETCSMIIKSGSSEICNGYKIVIKLIDAAIYVPTN